MGFKLKKELPAVSLAKFLGKPYSGSSVNIRFVSGLQSKPSQSLIFLKGNHMTPHNFKGVIISETERASNNIFSIVSENPRLDFIRALVFIETKVGFRRVKSKTRIGKGTKVGKFSYVEKGAQIGKNTLIGSNVIIRANVKIGNNCNIKSGSIIGETGFGFERDEAGIPIKFPHLGGVIIGDNVEIGALNTVACGTLSNTIIQDNVKIDDHVFIAHNCNIGENTLIIACSQVSGSVHVGKNVWIGPNSSIINKVKIGDGCFIGMGSVVVKDCPPGSTFLGNPAEEIEEFKDKRSKLKKFLGEVGES